MHNIQMVCENQFSLSYLLTGKKCGKLQSKNLDRQIIAKKISNGFSRRTGRFDKITTTVFYLRTYHKVTQQPVQIQMALILVI